MSEESPEHNRLSEEDLDDFQQDDEADVRTDYLMIYFAYLYISEWCTDGENLCPGGP
jgi:hypothetical protein